MRKVILLTLWATAPAHAQILSYPDPCLDFVFPAGAQRGQTVTVELGGTTGLAKANRLLIDGPPGITVKDVQPISPGLVKATLVIAPDAAPGRRWLRVLGGANGLTNSRPFFVGTLPEILEKEANNTPAAAQDIVIPAVVNGRIERDLDVDCYRFAAKAGQKIVAAVLGHGMDSTVRIAFNTGYLDTSLELLDEKGKVLAAADDVLGLDPVLEYAIPKDGQYTLRVQTLAYKGSAGSVYRLTVGDLPYPTHVFPAGGQRGATLDATWGGLNLKSPLPHKIALGKDAHPFQYELPPLKETDGRDFLLLRGEHPQIVEQEPNDDAKKAQSLVIPSSVQGRFATKNDEDWYRVSLKKGQGVILEVTAQRHWRGPVDSLLEVFDAAGKKLAENDDGRVIARPNHADHEFSSADSWLDFTPPADGDYFVRLRDQNNTGDPRAIYRFTVTPLQPDLKLFLWPDAVPIWGAGSTATFLIESFTTGSFKGDLELRVEGLPAGWKGSVARLSAASFYQPPYCMRIPLTITAPADAPQGSVAEFHVVGKIVQDGKTIERRAQSMTLYGNSHNDGMLLRPSPVARAAVAPPMDCKLETSLKEVSAKHGETIQIPVKIHRLGKGPIGLVVNGPTVAAGCGLGPPRVIPNDQDEVMLPLTISPEMPLGPRGIVVARSWSSDIRGGRPGPCTPIIQLTVLPK